MASDLSADAPAFNPAGACDSLSDGDHSGDTATAQAAADSGVAQAVPASQSQPFDSRGGANIDGSDNLRTADAGEASQLQSAAQPKPVATTGAAGLYGQGFPAYMVNCYPFVRQPPPSAAGNDIVANATLVSPRSVDSGDSLDYHFHSNAKGANSPEWLLTHSSVSMGAYPYVAAGAPAAFVGAHAAVSPSVMQLYGGGTGSWPAMQASAGSSGYQVYPPLAVAAHSELPFRTAGERGRLPGPGAHRGGRAGGGRRGARWSGVENAGVAGSREGGGGAWGRTSDESHSVATGASSSAHSYKHGGRSRHGDDEMAPADGSAGKNGWIHERVAPAQAKRGTVSVGTQNESKNSARAINGGLARPRTQIVKDACSQTDLADNIAHLTLQEKPSSFYVGSVAGSTEAAFRGRGRRHDPRSSSINDGVGRTLSAEAGISTSPAAWRYSVGRTVRSSAADVVDGDQSPLHRTDGAVGSRRLRCDPTAGGSVESTASSAEASRRAGCDRAALQQDGGGSSRQSPALAATHRSGAVQQRTAAVVGGQALSGDCGSQDGASDGFANVGDTVVTEATRKRRSRRGPRKSKAATAAAISAAAAAVVSEQHDGVAGDGEEEKEDCANPITAPASQRRLLADVVKSRPLAVRHVTAPGIKSADGGASESEESHQATSNFPVSSCAVVSRGPLPANRGGGISGVALVSGAHSYSQALLKTTQPSAAPRRPPAVVQSAWAVKEAQSSNQSDHAVSDHAVSDAEKPVDGGFMFNSVSYASRASVSGTGPRRPNSGGTRGSAALSVTSGGDRSLSSTTVVASAAAAVAGESLDSYSDSTTSGSRRQKKAESARLAAAEEQMEISLEQRVLLGQIGRLAAAAPPPANEASKKQSHPVLSVSATASAAPATASSGKKSRQALSLNLSDMIAAAAATAANKKKEAASRDEAQGRKLGDATKRAGAKSFATASAPNSLDSTAPTIKRGKEREKPKVKRPSALKKVILKERQDRKQSHSAGAAAAVVALGASTDGQLSGGGVSGDMLSSSCGGSDDIRLLGRGSEGIAPTSSSGCSGQQGIDDDMIVNLEVRERQQPLDASFEGTMALSTPGGNSGRLSSRGSGDAFTPASQASFPLSPISQTSPISVEALSPESSPFASEAGTPVRPIEVAKEVQLQQEIAHKIHSRRFREYCDQLLDGDIDEACSMLLHELVRFQERLFARDPLKAKTRRRLVLGLREVTKHLRLRKIKLVIVSPNVERIQSKGGLDDALSTVVALCREQTVPLVFALGRRALGRACGKLVPVSVAGVFMYDGAEIHYRRLMELTQKARDGYEEMIKLVALEAAEERQKLAAVASGRSSPPVPKQPLAGFSASTAVGERQPHVASSGGGQATAVGRWQTISQQQPQTSMQLKLTAAALPLDLVRIAAAGKEGASGSAAEQRLQQAGAASHSRQLVTTASDNDDGADEEAVRRRHFEFDGDAGNDADVEDSLQDSVAVPGYHRLLNGGGGETKAVPMLPIVTRQPLSRKVSGRDQAVARPPPADVESDGSTALAASATVTCSSSSSSCSTASSSCGSDASTTGPGRGGGSNSKKRRGQRISRRKTGSRAAADGAVATHCGELSAAAATAAGQPLLPDIRERVESWVASHSKASADAAAAAPTAADLLDVDDVAEFTATLSACTANSDALLLGAVGSGGP